MSKKKPFEEVSRIIDANIEKILFDRFARYSKYIIQDRALPDVRDGLKPVQRRILYAMYKDNNTSDRPHRKSAKTVGNVIGNYHPHGDTSVYEAMVRLSQDWKMREPLVDMHGNNGSIDNDPPAAMRYTEARLSEIADEMLRDIDKNTVDFTPNFDDTELEPTVLPARIPNILVNGSQGISAGYATEIPPHNLGEVIDAVIYRINHPFSTVDDLMQFVKGPDFPTGGIVQGLDGIKNAYETGKGKIIIRAKYEFDEKKKQIIVTDIPYDVNKANLMRKLEDIRLEKVLDGYVEARDETDKNGLRIVIEGRKDANLEFIMNYLLKNTNLLINYNFNMVVIHNRRPVQLGLAEILDAYIEHQKEVITNRSNYELAKARKRMHISEGLVYMVSVLDDVIQMIRRSKNKNDAKKNLCEAYDFTEEQAEAIVTLQLYRLTTTDVAVLEKELKQLTKQTKQLEAILSDEKKLNRVIIKELTDIKEKYANPRRTEIQEEIETIEIDELDMIKEEDVFVTVSQYGYIRATYQLDEEEVYTAKDLSERDHFVAKLKVNTLDDLLIFTNKGNYCILHTHQIPMGKKFNHINDFVKLEPEEFVISVIPVKDYNHPLTVLLATKSGYIKRCELKDLHMMRNHKTYVAIPLNREDDECICAELVPLQGVDVCIVTREGYMLKYDIEEVSLLKTKARGVKCINLKEEEAVVHVFTIKDDAGKVVLVTQRGNIKTIDPKEIPSGSRTNRGTMTFKRLKRNNHIYIGAQWINHGEYYFIDETDGYIPLTADTQYLSDLKSNGKAHSDLKDKETLVRLSSILTNEDFKFVENINAIDNKEIKEQKGKQEKSKNEELKEQISLFHMENLNE